jgi:hypothetical protein
MYIKIVAVTYFVINVEFILLAIKTEPFFEKLIIVQSLQKFITVCTGTLKCIPP